jgi:hypothetical protein
VPFARFCAVPSLRAERSNLLFIFQGIPEKAEMTAWIEKMSQKNLFFNLTFLTKQPNCTPFGNVKKKSELCQSFSIGLVFFCHKYFKK